MYSAKNIKSLIDKSNNILLALHISPDGDSVGSNLSFYEAFKDSKNIEIISYDEPPSFLENVAELDKIKIMDPADVNWNNYDLFVGLDMQNPTRFTKDKNPVIPSTFNTINIDHHSGNTNWGTLNYVDINKASTTQMLLDLYNQMGINISEKCAKYLLIGLLTDTGFFGNSNTNTLTLKTAYELAKLTDYYDVVWNLTFNEDIDNIKLKGIIYSNLKIDSKRKIAYSTCSINEMKLNNMDTTKSYPSSSDFIKTIKDIDYVFTIKDKIVEDKTMYSVSFRARNMKLDISKIASALGGGGHKAAAAARIEAKSIEDALNTVLNTIDSIDLNN